VRLHNIVTDPLPEASFDLIHARLVLVHLPEREKVLARLMAALKPGGWLVDEEFDSSMSPDPAVNPAEVRSKTFLAMGRIVTSPSHKCDGFSNHACDTFRYVTV
jgi:trans-aconitate methyltransferase